MATQNLTASTSALPSVLVSQQLTSTAETTVYTCPANSAVKIGTASLSNISGSSCTIGLAIVKTGGTADNTHRIIPTAFPLAASDWKTLKDELSGHWLGPGDFISVIAGTANAIDVIISGVVFS
jgi:hypothetical protein